MTVVYFDASAFVKLFMNESGSETALDLWDGCDIAVSSRLAYPEVRAALAAAFRAHRMSSADLDRFEGEWMGFWAESRAIELSRDVAEHAGALAAEFSLSGADAVHLASALAAGDDTTVLATWDDRLRTAGSALGMTVAPA